MASKMLWHLHVLVGEIHVQLPQGCHGARLHADDVGDQVLLHPGCHVSLQLLIALNFVKYLLPVYLYILPVQCTYINKIPVAVTLSKQYLVLWLFSFAGLYGICEEAIAMHCGMWVLQDFFCGATLVAAFSRFSIAFSNQSSHQWYCLKYLT